MNKNNKLTFLAAGLVIATTLLASSVFTVSEGYKAVKLRFDKIVRTSGTTEIKNADGTTETVNGQVAVYGPGLHFKLPFVDRVLALDARIQTLDDEADRFVTLEKKDVLIDSYVKWKIQDFGRFYTTTGGNYRNADALLKRKINDRLRNEVGSQTISEIVSGTRSELMSSALEALNRAEDGASAFGIEVVDVRVNKIELPEEVSNSIYQRMRAERQVVAGEHRAQGQQEAQKIRAETDREVAYIIADAKLTAKKIRSNADARAAEIYNQTYAQNLEFFDFLKTLDSYKESFAKGNSVLLVNPNTNAYYQGLLNQPQFNYPLNTEIK